MKIIAYYDDGWFDSDVTDFRMWDHLCRAYGVELQMIRNWDEAIIPDGAKIYAVDEEGEMSLEEHTIDMNGVYVFGRTHLDLLKEIDNYEQSIRIDTPNAISLFGIVAAGILLSRL